jgi:hypothetical protein
MECNQHQAEIHARVPAQNSLLKLDVWFIGVWLKLHQPIASTFKIPTLRQVSKEWS